MSMHCECGRVEEEAVMACIKLIYLYFMEVLRDTLKNVVRLASSLTGVWIKYQPHTNQMCCHRANLLRSDLVCGKMSVCLRWGEFWHVSQSNFNMEFVQNNAIYIRFIFITSCVTMFYTLTATFLKCLSLADCNLCV